MLSYIIIISLNIYFVLYNIMKIKEGKKKISMKICYSVSEYIGKNSNH